MKPKPKVVAGGIAGAITGIIVWIAKELGLDIPPAVASYLTVAVSFAASWLKSELA